MSRAFLRILLALLIALTTGVLWGQSCSIPGQAGAVTLTAQPNTFFPGTANANTGATSIAVGVATGVNTGIQVGDLLLIIQMQGADINYTSTNSYGDGTAHAGVTSTVAYGAAGYAGGVLATNFYAGNYEWAIATAATPAAGGTVQISQGLTRTYYARANSSTLGKQSFQVIRVPQYSNITLGAGFSLQRWNGSTGGLLVLDAAGTINLNGQTINGSGMGFRGAGVRNGNARCNTNGVWNGSGCQQYVAINANDLGGSKGEGIAGTPVNINNNGTVTNGAGDGYPGGESARGAPGNAGGGGNQHNAGGGGGGNGGAGGKGGNTWNFGNAANRGPGLPLGGFGGAPSASSAARWLMGGGGGAGDSNDGSSPQGSGGAAGGMVVLRASRLQGAGTINLNGSNGIDISSTDGTGGGGAGGTAIVAIGTGGVSGAVTITANGGRGGNYLPAVYESDGPGGGGGGGLLIHNIATGSVTFTASGGAAGTSNANATCAPNCGAAAGSATAGAVGYAITSPGVQVGYECPPDLRVTVTNTGTPTIGVVNGQTIYSIQVENYGGGARFATLYFEVPNNFAIGGAGGYSYTAYLPVSRVEPTAVQHTATWPTASTSPTLNLLSSNPAITGRYYFSPIAIAPIRAGAAPFFSIYNLSIFALPSATAGTYHFPAGVSFLDPTRPAVSTRTVAPVVNNTANRNAQPYNANTTYANYNGVSTVTVGGSNFQGTPTGPTSDNLTLVADFSVTKTAPATVSPGNTLSYTITARNNGFGIATHTYSITQATDVSLAQIPTVLAANPLTLTDTLPAGVSLSSTTSTGAWACSGTSTLVCTLPNANAYPIASQTDYATIGLVATATAACGSSARTNTVVISQAVGELVSSNNSATVTTSISCANALLTVSKTNGTNTVVAGGTTSYTITVANLGPDNAPGVVVKDTSSAGLSCTSVTCSATAGASCPASPTVAALQGAGLTITPSFNANSTVTFNLLCNITATGLP